MNEKISDLASANCKPCEDGMPPLERADAERYLQHLASDWRLSDDGRSISREYRFKDYYETIAFVNVAAMVAHQQDHHPDMTVGYDTCLLTYYTHSIDGLSENDFICAAKTDSLLSI